MNLLVEEAFVEHRRLLDEIALTFAPTIEQAALTITTALGGGGTIFWCGNGGSAADAQHLSAELIGRFRRERRALAAVALTTDTSVLTCVGNDYSFDDIFSRQIEALGRKGDVLVAISTSGNSANVLKAVEKAGSQGLAIIGLLGRDGGRIASLCNHGLVVPGRDTARIQEMHILLGHILCDLVEASFCE